MPDIEPDLPAERTDVRKRVDIEREMLGAEAVAALDRLVAAAPPFTPEQRDAIAVLLGHQSAARDEAA